MISLLKFFSHLISNQFEFITSCIAMKRSFKPVAFVLLLTCTAMAAFSQPVVSFKEKEFDFGTIKEADGIVKHNFSFINSGNDTLRIAEVNASCGCTTAETESKQIAPGGKSTISVTFNPKDIRGKFGKTITVFSNATSTEIALKIFGTIIPINTSYSYSGPFFQYGNLKLSTPKLSFDSIFDSKIYVDSVLMVNCGTKVMTVAVNETNGILKCYVKPSVLNPGEAGYVIFSIDPTEKTLFGDFFERVQLITSDSIMPTKQISAKGYIKEDFSKLTNEERENAPVFSLKQEVYDFGEIKQGQKAEAIFEVANTGKSILIFHKIKPACGCTTLNSDISTLKPGEKIQLKFSFDSKGKSDGQDKSILIISNDPKKPVLHLRIVGKITI
jgi:hypothetical protein